MNISPTIDSSFVDSTNLLSSPEKLRARAEQDGFLFFKNFLPKEPLLELRRQILQIIDRQGWIKKGTELMDGVADLEATARADGEEKLFKGAGVTREVYRDIQCLELFHAIPHHPKLMALYSSLFQEAAFPHPRHIACVLVPSPSAAPTPPHQDYIYIQGTHNFWTLWFPLGDCPMDLGGLSVLRGSHREKVLDVHTAPGAGGFESNLCKDGYEWVKDNYECGDIITFPSHLIHKGLPNEYGDRIRLSCDCRYQPSSEEIVDGSLMPHMKAGTWEEIYKNWKSKDLQYYWKSKTFQFATWDPSLLVNKERIC